MDKKRYVLCLCLVICCISVCAYITMHMFFKETGELELNNESKSSQELREYLLSIRKRIPTVVEDNAKKYFQEKISNNDSLSDVNIKMGEVSPILCFPPRQDEILRYWYPIVVDKIIVGILMEDYNISLEKITMKYVADEDDLLIEWLNEIEYLHNDYLLYTISDFECLVAEQEHQILYYNESMIDNLDEAGKLALKEPFSDKLTTFLEYAEKIEYPQKGVISSVNYKKCCVYRKMEGEGCSPAKIVIPEDTELIADGAFANVPMDGKMVKLKFQGKRLKKIGRMAFTVGNLKEVILPEGLEEISTQAFFQAWGFNKAVKIVIPSTVKRIGTVGLRSFLSQDGKTTYRILSKDVEYYFDKKNCPQVYTLWDTFAEGATVYCYKGSTTDQLIQKENIKVKVKYIK